jgi:hypothetical protein
MAEAKLYETQRRDWKNPFTAVKNHRSRLLIGRTIFLTVKIDVCGL